MKTVTLDILIESYLKLYPEEASSNYLSHYLENWLNHYNHNPDECIRSKHTKLGETFFSRATTSLFVSLRIVQPTNIEDMLNVLLKR